MAPPSPLLDAAFSILADGKPRTADEILAEGVRRGLFDATQTRKHIYTALSQYVERTLGRGRKPFITEDHDRRFRLNRPIDDWPDIDTTGLPPLVVPAEPSPQAKPIVAALRDAAAGSDPATFERAVCATFDLLGFVATHIGGNDAPDGYADAVLGPLAYRVMIECKLSRDDNVAHSSAVAEAAKYRDAYRANSSALIAPSFDAEVTFVSELQTHRVAAWSVDDLVRAATLRLNPWTMRGLFAPGFAADPLDDLAWDQLHGRAKRLRVIASLLIEAGLAHQQMAHNLCHREPSAVILSGVEGRQTAKDSIPPLSIDVALTLLDDRLITGGSGTPVKRDEMAEAFYWLTSPYVGLAVWTDDARTAIVILAAPN